MNKTIYKILLLRKEGLQLNLIRVLKLTEIKSLIRYNEKTFAIDISQPAFIEKNFRIYFIDIDSNMQYQLLKSDKIGLNSDELDTIISNKLIREITQSTTDTKDKWVNMIIGAIMGALIAGFIALGFVNSKLEEIYTTMFAM